MPIINCDSCKDMPKLSVVIPCWNANLHIAELLESIIAQTYQNWQVFAVDDHSTDNTEEIILSFQNKDSRIHYKKRDRLPKGAQTCRNIGLELSTDCDYIMFVDSDDLLAPFSFAQRVNFLKSHPEIDFAVFPAKTFSHSIWDKNSFLLGVDNCCDIMEALLMRVLPFSVWNNIYRLNSILKKQIKWDENIQSLQDTDYNIQSICQNMVCLYADDAKIDYFWRITNSQKNITSKIRTKEHFHSHIYFIRKLQTSLTKKQQIKYSKALKWTIIEFVEIMKNEKIFIKELLQILNDGYFSFSFKLRLRLYTRVKNNKKIKHFLFPLVVKHYLNFEREHAKILHKKYIELIKLQY